MGQASSSSFSSLRPYFPRLCSISLSLLSLTCCLYKQSPHSQAATGRSHFLEPDSRKGVGLGWSANKRVQFRQGAQITATNLLLYGYYSYRRVPRAHSPRIGMRRELPPPLCLSFPPDERRGLGLKVFPPSRANVAECNYASVLLCKLVSRKDPAQVRGHLIPVLEARQATAIQSRAPSPTSCSRPRAAHSTRVTKTLTGQSTRSPVPRPPCPRARVCVSRCACACAVQPNPRTPATEVPTLVSH